MSICWVRTEVLFAQEFQKSNPSDSEAPHLPRGFLPGSSACGTQLCQAGQTEWASPGQKRREQHQHAEPSLTLTKPGRIQPRAAPQEGGDPVAGARGVSVPSTAVPARCSPGAGCGAPRHARVSPPRVTRFLRCICPDQLGHYGAVDRGTQQSAHWQASSVRHWPPALTGTTTETYFYFPRLIHIIN